MQHVRSYTFLVGGFLFVVMLSCLALFLLHQPGAGLEAARLGDALTPGISVPTQQNATAQSGFSVPIQQNSGPAAQQACSSSPTEIIWTQEGNRYCLGQPGDPWPYVNVQDVTSISVQSGSLVQVTYDNGATQQTDSFTCAGNTTHPGQQSYGTVVAVSATTYAWASC